VITEDAESVSIFGVNETELSISGELRFGVFNLAGGQYPLDFHLPVTIPANSAREIAGFSRDQWADPAASAAFATLTAEGRLLARNRLLLPFFKDLRWPAATPADVRIDRTPTGGVTFSADQFVWGVCLDLDGQTARDDNFFDIYPGQSFTIPWPGESAPTVLRVGNLA
jgi:hypothetical protein